MMPAESAHAPSPWRVELLGGLRARRGEDLVTHFRSRQTGALLALLAFYRGRSFGHAALIEMLWPGCDEKAGRNRLSVALSSLRSQLELEDDSLFLAGRDTVAVRADRITTDVAEFEGCLKRAAQGPDAAREALPQALRLYRGELLPGCDEEWIGPQARRLEEEFFRAARRLIALHRESGERAAALHVAQRAVLVDATREDLQRELMRLLAQTGQLEAARKQGQEVERVLRERLGCAPDATTRALMRELDERAQTGVRRASSGSPSRVVNCPAPLTRFFGRQADLQVLAQWLRSPHERLLTLLGPGGSGKTRLMIESARALEAEAEALGRFAGGAWFVSLAEVGDAAQMPEALRGALRLPPSPGLDAMAQVEEALSSGAALLLLDNFEQLVPEGAPALQRLLEALPGLRILVTSRRKLGIPGERGWDVAPLPVRGDDLGEQSGEDEAVGAALALFHDRARLARPDFALPRAAATALCARLDGLPLALELAAARCNVLSVEEILGHLGSRGDVLEAQGAGVAPRHRTLRAAIEWSFRLLPPELQQFWARLSVFRGGWTLEAAQEVCGEKGALDALSRLRDCSLITAADDGGATRFGLLETLAEFADEQLSAPARAQAGRAHGFFFERLAFDSEPGLQGPQQARWLLRLDAESANLEAALSWAQRHDPAALLRMSVKLSSYWECRGRFERGALWLQSALQAQAEHAAAPNSKPSVKSAIETLPSGLKADALFWRGRAQGEAGRMCALAGDLAAARRHLREAITIFRARQDDIALAWIFNVLGEVLSRQGRQRLARALHDRALAIARRHGYRELEADCLQGLARLATGQGDEALLESTVAARLSLERALGNARGVALAEVDAALLAMLRGDLARGCRLCRKSLQSLRGLQEPWGAGRAGLYLGAMLRRRGQSDAARDACLDALESLLPTGSPGELVELLEQLALLAARGGAWPAAVRWLSAAQSTRRGRSLPRPALWEAEWAQSLAQAREHLGEGAFASSWEEGESLGLEQALAQALAQARHAAAARPSCSP